MSRLSRGRKSNPSIYKRLKDKEIEANPLPILTHGGKLSQQLHMKCDRIINPGLARIKVAKETLKLSAALSGSYSLSANQLGLPMSLFTVHKDLPYGEWMCEQAVKLNTQEAELEQENAPIQMNTEYLLDPKDFETFMNPKILGETFTQEYQWEFCQSFPNIRCMVKRPIGIHVRYLNEDNEEVEQKLYDFHARMFLHEMDHLEGKSMMHWSLSEGNIDVLRDHQESNVHFMSTVQFYKTKIDDLKKNFIEMFDDIRKYEKIVDDGHEWKQFPNQERMHDKLVEDEKYLAPTFEETMLIDSIRAIRKDKKDAARRMNPRK